MCNSGFLLTPCGRSKRPEARSRAGGCSNSASRIPGPEAVPEALRAFQGAERRRAERIRTEIVSPANKQYKIALRAFQEFKAPRRVPRALAGVPVALRAFQDPLDPPYEGEEGFRKDK